LRADSTFHNKEKARNEIMKKKVLFICVQNSARSQIAAALLNKECSDYFEAHSAGLEPGVLNPLAVEALQELGIGISGNKTQSVFDVWASACHIFAYVITVCSESEAKGCPIFAGVTTRLHWSFPDPSKFTGTHEERLEQTRRVIDQIQAKIASFCEEHCATAPYG
jgi:arsenate reductase (thioredoxin)